MISKIDDVFYLDVPNCFGSDEENYTSEEIETIMDECDKNVECRYGASKFVMLFDGSNKVVKIPMNGSWSYNYNDNADYDDPVWEPFATADYCALEALIYEAAVEAGLEMFFASTVEAGRTSKGCGVPYYISERVNTGYDYDYEYEPSDDSKKKAREMTNRGSVSIDFVAAALDFYGEVLVKEFLDFVREWEINDLHDDNIGYRNDGSPVLLDYSGFRS